MQVTLTEGILGPDVLSRNQLKPWWEMLRGYVFTAMLGSSFIMVYTNKLENNVHCRVAGEVTITLHMEDILYINAFCYSQVDSFYSYADTVAIGYTVLTYLAFNWWLLAPCVVNGFDSVREADLVLERLRSQSHSLIEKRKKMKKVLLKLWNRGKKSGWRIPEYYSVRNFIGVLILFGLITHFLVSMKLDDSTFNCSMDHSSNSSQNWGLPEQFQCVDAAHLKLKSLVWVFIITAFLQALISVFVVSSLVSPRWFQTATSSSSENMPIKLLIDSERENYFILKFSEHSKALSLPEELLLPLRHKLEIFEHPSMDDLVDYALRLLHRRLDDELGLFFEHKRHSTVVKVPFSSTESQTEERVDENTTPKEPYVPEIRQRREDVDMLRRRSRGSSGGITVGECSQNFPEKEENGISLRAVKCDSDATKYGSDIEDNSSVFEVGVPLLEKSD